MTFNDLRIVEITNQKFNDELALHTGGLLREGHVYRLGRIGDIPVSAGIPDLPVELAASRLTDKSMQENHPYDISELKGLPEAMKKPLAVFRSATHIGHYVIMTELEHAGKNYGWHCRPANVREILK